MTFHDATAMPPLLVRPQRGSESLGDMLLAPWMPLARPLGGRLWCDVVSPSGNLLGGHVDFPTGCTPAMAIESILGRWHGRPDPVAAWLDGGRARGEPVLPPPLPMSRDRSGNPTSQATLSELPGSGGRMFLVSGEPGATLFLDDKSSSAGPRTIVARDGHIACIRRTDHAEPEWTVIPGLGPAGTYWTYAHHHAFAAMRAVAFHLIEAHAEGDAPDEVLAVLAHAALTLRYLGADFRDAVVRMLARSPSDDLDVIALAWCLRRSGVGRDVLQDRTERMAALLATRYPTYAATAWCLGERLSVAVDERTATGGQAREALTSAAEAMASMGNALEGHATLVLGYDP